MGDAGTIWNVRSSVGLDALAFLGPLAGAPLYQTYHGRDADEFSARLDRRVVSSIERLWAASQDEGFGLLGPTLQLILSGDSESSTLEGVGGALSTRRSSLLPPYRASAYWDESAWSWFDRNADELAGIVLALESAGFESFWDDRARDLPRRIRAIQNQVAGVDVVSVQQRLTGRALDPRVEIVLLLFARPHGVRVQGQTFLQAFDNDAATTLKIAAHELLHPPFDADGPAARAALSILERDVLITAVVREHDARWGYRTLPALLDEDLVQALDQLVAEQLGIAADPGERWNRSDDGMHVLAAGFYGLLRDDHWGDRGGAIQLWLHDAAARGRLAPDTLHASAARVLGKDVGHLWA